MKILKRLLSTCIILALCLGLNSISAFAQSDTFSGTHGGYSYNGYAKCSSSVISVSLASSNPAKKSCPSTITYKKNGKTYTYSHNETKSIKTFAYSKSFTGSKIVSLNSTFKIGSYAVYKTYLTA